MKPLAICGLILCVLLIPFSSRGDRIFFGDLHNHTAYSDGLGTAADAYEYARDTAKLDFLAITDHNHAQAEQGAKGDRKDGKMIGLDHALYTDGTVAVAEAVNKKFEGRFVALYGQEFSSIKKGNHANVFDISEVITVPNGRYDELIGDWLRQRPDSQGLPALIQFNHPDGPQNNEYGGNGTAPDADWLEAMDKHAQLIEVICGPALSDSENGRCERTCEAQFLAYLNMGFHLAPTSGQDDHLARWGNVTDARTAVIAPALNKADILDALRNRHVYATEDKDLEVIFTAAGHLMGTCVNPPPPKNTHIPIELTIQDEDEPFAEYQIELFADTVGGKTARVIDVRSVTGNEHADTPLIIEDVVYTGRNQYFFVKITQSIDDAPDDRVWTAPVWFEKTRRAT